MCIYKTFLVELRPVNEMAAEHPVDSSYVQRVQEAVTDPDLAEKCRTCLPGCNIKFGAEVIGVAQRVAPELARSNGSRLFHQ